MERYILYGIILTSLCISASFCISASIEHNGKIFFDHNLLQDKIENKINETKIPLLVTKKMDPDILKKGKLKDDRKMGYKKAVRERRSIKTRRDSIYTSYGSTQEEFELTPDEVDRVFKEVPEIVDDIEDAATQVKESYRDALESGVPELVEILSRAKDLSSELIDTINKAKEELEKHVGSTLPPLVTSDGTTTTEPPEYYEAEKEEDAVQEVEEKTEEKKEEVPEETPTSPPFALQIPEADEETKKHDKSYWIKASKFVKKRFAISIKPRDLAKMNGYDYPEDEEDNESSEE